MGMAKENVAIGRPKDAVKTYFMLIVVLIGTVVGTFQYYMLFTGKLYG
jgi:hypothetical protein